MKKLIFILLLLGLTSCVDSKKYTLDITYMNGDKDTVEINSSLYPGLIEGDLRYNGRTFVSGVRSFKVLKEEKYDR